jgi:hypothetical protein
LNTHHVNVVHSDPDVGHVFFCENWFHYSFIRVF